MNEDKPTTSKTGKQTMVIFVVFLAIGLGAAWIQGHPGGMPCEDAVIRCGIGNDLLDGFPRGRQGLVGSLRWAPLPTLAVLPLLKISPLMHRGFAACAAAAASWALLCAFLNGWWARHKTSSWLRFAALLALFGSPPVLRDIASGSSNGLFVLLGAATLCFLIDWWETDELRPLAYLSLVVALGIITRYHFVLVFAVVLMAVFLHLRLRGRRHSYAQGTLIIVVTPTLYLLLLWTAANWLIMGDPFFFLRGLPWRSFAWLVRHDVAWGARIAALGREWIDLVHEGCAWDALLAPCLLALLGWAGGLTLRRHPRLAAMPAAIFAVALLCLGGQWRLSGETNPLSESRRVVRYLQTLDEENTILVSGYRGYELAYLGGPRLQDTHHFVHTVSLYLDDVFERTRGKGIYIAIPPPTGDNCWEDVHIKFPRLYSGGARFALFEREVDRWRIMWLVRIDQPPR